MLTYRKLAILACSLVVTMLGQNNPAPAPNGPGGGGGGIPVAVDNKTYKIGPQDVLRIQVYMNPELSETVVVQTDGMIGLQLIDDFVQADGLTPNELKIKLTQEWKKTINSPEVTVSVIEVRSKTYKLMGYVNRPSTYPITHPIYIAEALADAGGFLQYANKKDIHIIRDNGKVTLKFNWNDWVKGKNLDQNILLQNGDIVEVHD
jgi:polysaccharide export outer membrane protein